MYNNRLKEARLNAKLTQEDVAKRIGVFKTTISGYETGRSEPCMAHLISLMEIYGVDANWLLQDEMAEPDVAETPLSSDEAELLALYRRLNSEGKSLVTATARMAAGTPDMQKENISSEMA